MAYGIVPLTDWQKNVGSDTLTKFDRLVNRPPSRQLRPVTLRKRQGSALAHFINVTEASYEQGCMFAAALAHLWLPHDNCGSAEMRQACYDAFTELSPTLLTRFSGLRSMYAQAHRRKES